MVENSVKGDYTGQPAPLFNIALKNAVLTLVTLGFYRFWARTRERKYMWSAIRPDGTALEYNGNGLEKFLGFLIAVAFLAIYLGVFQVLLSFGGYALFEVDERTGIGIPGLLFSISPILLLPLIFYAQYRGRRYVLSRTRWRGIRFGAEKKAWPYVRKALWELFLVVLTLGILYPRMVFKLEEFRTNHSYFGNAQFHQGGRWQSLYGAAKQFYIAIGILVFFAVILIANGGSIVGGGAGFLAALAFFVGYIWLIVGVIAFRANAWRMMANDKTLGGKISFVSEMNTPTVVKRTIFGFIGVGFVAGLVATVTSLILASVLGGFSSNFVEALTRGDVAGLIGIVIFYLVFFTSFVVLTLVWVTQPVLREYVSTLHIQNPEALDEIIQREGDDFVEAEGFADALDVGAAI